MEEAVVKQMEMQRQLHSQLEVRTPQDFSSDLETSGILERNFGTNRQMEMQQQLHYQLEVLRPRRNPQAVSIVPTQ